MSGPHRFTITVELDEPTFRDLASLVQYMHEGTVRERLGEWGPVPVDDPRFRLSEAQVRHGVDDWLTAAAGEVAKHALDPFEYKCALR